MDGVIAFMHLISQRRVQKFGDVGCRAWERGEGLSLLFISPFPLDSFRR